MLNVVRTREIRNIGPGLDSDCNSGFKGSLTLFFFLHFDVHVTVHRDKFL